MGWPHQTSFCIWPVRLPGATTGLQLTHTEFFELGILGPATQNTAVVPYDQWGFKEQPQGQNLHIVGFQAGQTKDTSLGIGLLRLSRASTGSTF